MLNKATVQEVVNQGAGVLRLEPSWVPRSFMIPGRRLKLHPDDLYAFGAHRGGINERWFSSTTKASNGPDTTPDEGLSYVIPAAGSKFLLEGCGRGRRRHSARGRCHAARRRLEPALQVLRQPRADPASHAPERRVRQAGGHKGKPEAYYFPPQYNQLSNNFPHTYMGLEPGTTKADIRRCLENWNRGDNGIIFTPARLPSGARQRMASRSRHPARSRLAGHL